MIFIDVSSFIDFTYMYISKFRLTNDSICHTFFNTCMCFFNVACHPFVFQTTFLPNQTRPGSGCISNEVNNTKNNSKVVDGECVLVLLGIAVVAIGVVGSAVEGIIVVGIILRTTSTVTVTGIN